MDAVCKWIKAARFITSVASIDPEAPGAETVLRRFESYLRPAFEVITKSLSQRSRYWASRRESVHLSTSFWERPLVIISTT